MTNVYSVPEVRGKGLGSQLIKEVNRWAKEMNFEFIIVWPSEHSIDFYNRNGFQLCNDSLENRLDS
ncbi:GNAT family N-acetyltransferase [Chengkuizengella axinellae]|uniref:GNAT family N-acetyltransferase n=1 Tax=Chengkuizengella axinellae TaxID=3064388 RepID=A0ABT9J594_9BACL|nr:GNAT family N-acetyltransferase [Chengkuizengella sp. 2205SS18-9]MDP5276772.1 GNAT family N-acetyltransferase [Chengkuizengella sp. 2205SS18-9]